MSIIKKKKTAQLFVDEAVARIRKKPKDLFESLELKSETPLGDFGFYLPNGKRIMNFKIDIRNSILFISEFKIENWVGESSFSKIGLGSYMMNYIINLAKAKNLKKISLDSVLSAVDFYKKFGFKIVKLNDKLVKMELSL